MFDYQPSALEGLLSLFTFSDRRELIRYARTVVLDGSDLAAFILTCQTGKFPLRHRAFFSERPPSHLVPTDSDREAIQANEVGPLTPSAAKTVRKVSQLFVERRELAAHMFYTEGLHEWHLMTFDQNDLIESPGNHWSHGPHVHFINWLWTHRDPRDLWAGVVRAGKKPSGSLHIRHVERPCDARSPRPLDRS